MGGKIRKINQFDELSREDDVIISIEGITHFCRLGNAIKAKEIMPEPKEKTSKEESQKKLDDLIYQNFNLVKRATLQDRLLKEASERIIQLEREREIDNSRQVYTEEDMQKCFEAAKPKITGPFGGLVYRFLSFENYLKTIKK